MFNSGRHQMNKRDSTGKQALKDLHWRACKLTDSVSLYSSALSSGLTESRYLNPLQDIGLPQIRNLIPGQPTFYKWILVKGQEEKVGIAGSFQSRGFSFLTGPPSARTTPAPNEKHPSSNKSTVLSFLHERERALTLLICLLG